MESLAKKIYKVSHLRGKFKLRSGKNSNEYFDKYMFESQPEIMREIALKMSELIPKNTELLAGLEMGGVPLATAISLISNQDVLFVRKKAKEYGTCKIAEGKEFSGKRICIIEDVVTTGGQIIKSVRELRRQGAIVEDVICVIQREKKATVLLAQEGLRLKPLFYMDDLKDGTE